jgi:four helix bundle protein
MNDKREFKKQIELRTRQFAVCVFKFIESLEISTSTKIIGYQLGRSASSIGANYREANRSESKSDFVHKISIALKESSETMYWLEIVEELGYGGEKLLKIKAECEELLKLMQTINKSLRTGKNSNSTIP